VRPATFKELHLAETKVLRALATLSLVDRKRVIESVLGQIAEVETAPSFLDRFRPAPSTEPGTGMPRCDGHVNNTGLPCALYAAHTGEHRS
jgi:hypothetical protein